MSENLSNIVIKSNEEKGYTEIFVDGHKLKGVRSFELKEDVSGAPTLTVDLNAINLSVDCLCFMRHKGYGDMKITFIDDVGHEMDIQYHQILCGAFSMIGHLFARWHPQDFW